MGKAEAVRHRAAVHALVHSRVSAEPVDARIQAARVVFAESLPEANAKRSLSEMNSRE